MMPGLQRDVLRWLVALNLSFPIKNIKRDFSNGFMVAEIFSRYFPQDIHMHSYDYGSRLAMKRDNWEQLKKFFRKKGFTILNDEIDNIIQCTSDDGAAPLLERMYSFLTKKPKRPENPATQPDTKRDDYSSPWSNDEQPSDEGEDDDSGSGRGSCSGDEGELEDCGTCNRLPDDMYCDEAFHCEGLVRAGPDGCGFEFQPLRRLEIEESRDDPFSSFDTAGVRFLDDDGDELHLQDEDEAYQDGREEMEEEEKLGSRKKNVNAVEKARFKEDARRKRLEKAGLTANQMKQKTANQNSSSDPALAFRSPNRSRQTNFKQYTLPDYRRQNQFGYVRLGSLGHKETPELLSKRQALQRSKEFGRHARSCNTMSHPNPALAHPKKSPKPSSRKVALEFASSIPKPKVKLVKESSKENVKKVLPLQNYHTLTDLQILEMKHQSHKEHVEAIRRDLEHFLR